jgi:hypothetical protein
MAARLGMGDMAGAMRMAPQVSPPPAAQAAPPAIAVFDALGIETAGGDVEGVAQRALTTLPLRAVDETVQTAACTVGCAGGNCGETHVRTFVPAEILAATAPAVDNPYLNATTGMAADTGGGEAAQRA